MHAIYFPCLEYVELVSCLLKDLFPPFLLDHLPRDMTTHKSTSTRDSQPPTTLHSWDACGIWPGPGFQLSWPHWLLGGHRAFQAASVGC